MKKNNMRALYRKLADANGISRWELQREIKAALRGTEYEKLPLDEAIVMLAKKAKARLQ